jgi:hypothetical protein
LRGSSDETTESRITDQRPAVRQLPFADDAELRCRIRVAASMALGVRNWLLAGHVPHDESHLTDTCRLTLRNQPPPECGVDHQ